LSNHSVLTPLLVALALIAAAILTVDADAQEYCSYRTAVFEAAAQQLDDAYEHTFDALGLDHREPTSEEVELLDRIRQRAYNLRHPSVEALQGYEGMSDCPDDPKDKELEQLKLTIQEVELEYVHIHAELLLPSEPRYSVTHQDLIDAIIYARRDMQAQLDRPLKSARANLWGRLLLIKRIPRD